jgi:hypothetical protein
VNNTLFTGDGQKILEGKYQDMLFLSDEKTGAVRLDIVTMGGYLRD